MCLFRINALLFFHKSLKMKSYTWKEIWHWHALMWFWSLHWIYRCNKEWLTLDVFRTIDSPQIYVDLLLVSFLTIKISNYSLFTRSKRLMGELIWLERRKEMRGGTDEYLKKKSLSVFIYSLHIWSNGRTSAETYSDVFLSKFAQLLHFIRYLFTSSI